MRSILILSILLSHFFSMAQRPGRKALMGLQLSPVTKGLRVDSVVPNSTAAALKIKKGDVLMTLNQVETLTQDAYYKTATQIRSGDEVIATIARSGKSLSLSAKAVMRPYETSVLADVTYDWVKFKAGALRAITRKPKGRTHIPCILLIPGYGCGSIEGYSSGYNGKLINEWLKSGYAVVTIEKSGLGDSYGCQPCLEADLVTDIESYDAGYRYMERLPFVDTASLFVWGHSLGGIVAPEVAKHHHPKGVMVFGTVYRPWSEFLLEMHRVQKPLLEGMSYEQTEVFTREIQKVYYEFFVLKKSREQLSAIPEYKSLVAGELEYKEGSTNMWGRHWRFWQQIDSLNMAETWSRLSCRVLVINGGSDYEACAPIEPVLIEKTVNTAYPGHATRVQIDNLDHFMMESNSYEEAVKNFNTQQYAKGNFNRRLADETISWLNKTL